MNWEYMRDFAMEVIDHAILHHRRVDVFDQRIAIIHLDMATEILLKAFLLKKGFFINEINRKIKDGITENTPIIKFLAKKTIIFEEALNLALKQTEFSNMDKELMKEMKKKIISFHNVRNELQHRAILLPSDKDVLIRLTYPIQRQIFIKMFPDTREITPNSLQEQ